MARKPIQFNWRRHWKKRVEPILGMPMVQRSLDVGMMLLDPHWKRGDPPHALGEWVPGRRIVKEKLSWYQPHKRCHWIVFFACAVGMALYPDLRWDIVSGNGHTVGVGFDGNDDPAVVMDILLFAHLTAEESLHLTRLHIKGFPLSDMSECYEYFLGILPTWRDAGIEETSSDKKQQVSETGLVSAHCGTCSEEGSP